MREKRILVTGCAGFIGSQLCRKLLESDEGVKITGIDDMNDYYPVSLKEDRLETVRSAGEAQAIMSISPCLPGRQRGRKTSLPLRQASASRMSVPTSQGRDA